MKNCCNALIVVLLTACACASALAESPDSKKMSLHFWGGYTTAGMNDVNSAIKEAASGGSVTEAKDGTLIAADLLYKAFPGVPGLSIGPRIEYLFISSGKLSQDAPLMNIKEDFYVVPVMVGGRYILSENKDWSLSGSLFLGVGIGYGKSAVTTAADPSNQTITKYSGSDMAGLLAAAARYRISDNTFLGVELGYRMLSISKMTIDSTSVSSLSSGGGGGGGGGYAPSRAPVVDPATGNNIKYDFSGMVLNIGIGFNF